MMPWGLARYFDSAKFWVGRPAKFPAPTPKPKGGLAGKFPRRDARIGLIGPNFYGYKSDIRGMLDGPRVYPPVGFPPTDRDFATFGGFLNATDAAPDLLRGSTPLPKESDIVLKGD